MTRLVQLANFYAPTSGGLRTAVEALGRGYMEAGVERFLIVPGPERRTCESDSGVRFTLPGPRLPGGSGYRVLASRAQVSQLLASLRPDHVEVSDKLSLSWVGNWARARGVPSLLLSHERLDAILAARLPRRFPLSAAADRWNARLVSSFDRVVATSAFGCDEFARIGAGNVVRVPLGVDLDRFVPGPGSAGRAVELVSVGRLSLEKRPELAVWALRRLRAAGVDARLTIAGDGPLAGALRARAAGMPVTFLGHVHDRDLLAGIIGTSDVFLATCPVEAFGLAVLESLACGTPVVTVEGGAAHELLDGGSGRSAAADGAALAAAVLDLLAAPPAGRRRAARARAERYPWTASVAGMLGAHDLRAQARGPQARDLRAHHLQDVRR